MWFKKRKEIYKLIKEEQKSMSKRVMYDSDDHLLLKLTSKEVKNSLDLKEGEEKIYWVFKADWCTFLSEFRKYYVNEEDALTVRIDPNCDEKTKETFKETWINYFKVRIIRQTKINHDLLKKIWYSSIAGFLVLSIVLTFNLLSEFMSQEVGKIFRISAICTESLSILAWVFLWEAYYSLFYELRTGREKLQNLYKMYKCKFEESKVSGYVVDVNASIKQKSTPNNQQPLPPITSTNKK